MTEHDKSLGETKLDALRLHELEYSLARSHLGRHPALSAIFEVAREWRENEFAALMTWIEGAPLREFRALPIRGKKPQLR
jgi:hypothetical protein